MVETIPAGAATDAVPASPRVFGFACMLVGVDPDLMAACPARDRDGVRLLAALMMLVWLWQSTVFAAVAHLMLAGPGEIYPGLIAAATLLATIILLIDAYVVMRSSWTGFGYEELRRGGLALRLPVSARVKGSVFLALRLALSAVVGTLVALFVSLILYGKDIAGQLATEHASRNASVMAAATRLVDGRIAYNASGQAELRARIAATDRAADGLRRGLAERLDPATASATAELARAERAQARAEADVTRHRRNAGAADLARVRRRLEETTASRDAARAWLTEAESRLISLAQGRDTMLTGQLTALDRQRQQDLDRLALSQAEQGNLLNERSAAIRAAVAADPAYIASDDGLLVRLHALKALTADPWIGGVVLLLEVFFAGIELAAVFAKLLSFVPATYATRLAREDQLRQIATAREITAALELPACSTALNGVSGSNDLPGALTMVSAPADAALIAEPAASRAVDPSSLSDVGQGGLPGTMSELTTIQDLDTVRPAAASASYGSLRRRRGRPPKPRGNPA